MYQIQLSQIADKRLIILHPQIRHRGAIIASLMYEAHWPVIYHSLGSDDTTLRHFIASLVEALAQQIGTKHTLTALPQADAVGLASALCTDLSVANNQHRLLVIDEFDRAPPEILAFTEHCLACLPDRWHILLNGRQMPGIAWMPLVVRQQAVVIQTEQSTGVITYQLEAPTIEVRAFGPGIVYRNGELVDWEGQLPRLLFFYMLDRRAATRDRICSTFWPELPVKQAVNVFHVTKRRLHRILDMDVLLHRGGQYHLNHTINLHYDVKAFVDCLSTARLVEGPTQLSHLKRAVSLYRGPYLETCDTQWVVSRRAEFRAGYLEVLLALGRHHKEHGSLSAALDTFHRAAVLEPQREDIRSEVRHTLTRMGRRDEIGEWMAGYSDVAQQSPRTTA